MADAIQIMNSFLEDDNCNIFFPYVGKDSVLGLTHPSYTYKNVDKYKYAMVALYKLVDTGDTGYQQFLDECLTVSLASSATIQNNPTPIIKSSDIHISGFGNSGNITNATIRVTNNLPDSMDNGPDSKFDTNMKVFGCRVSYTNDNGDEKVGLGIWIDTTDIMYVNTNVKDSLSTGSCPMDAEHFPASYSAQYLCNSTAEANANLLNNKDIIEENLIAEGISSVNTINKDLEDIHKAIDGQPHQFESNTVTYNPVYTPSAAGAEDVVPPFGVRVNNGDKFIGVDSVNKIITVPKAGIYQLQLKNGFYLIQGESRVDVRVYINDNEIKEMGISLYLTSNTEGTENPSKAIKNIFSSNSYMTRLSTTDKIKVTATWMNIDNIQIENETMLTVTAMQFNLK